MNLRSFKGTPDRLKLRFKGFGRKLSLGAPDLSLIYTQSGNIEKGIRRFIFDFYTVQRANKEYEIRRLIFDSYAN